LLSTDTWCLVIILDLWCDMVDFLHMAASRGLSALANTLVDYVERSRPIPSRNVIIVLIML